MIQRYEIEAIIETDLNHETMVSWLKGLGFHTIKVTKDDNYFEEVFEFLQTEIGDGIFYRYYYQIVPIIKEVHATKTSAIKRIVYFENSRSYANSFYYEKYIVQSDTNE